VCAWHCSKEGDKTQQAIVFLPLQKNSRRYAQQQPTVPKKNVFAPDQQSFSF
jgi:hypothetical protein